METVGCAYAKLEKCKTCPHVRYEACANYRLWRIKWLIQPLLPITLKKLDPLPLQKCYVSRDEETARQFAAVTAIKHKKRLVKLSMNQMFTIVLENLPIESPMYYIEAKKLGIEPQKVSSMMESFVDKVLLLGGTVFIYAAIGVSMADDWTKLPKHDK